MYKHYIRVDTDDNVIRAFSDAFEQPQPGDLLVTENGGRHFNLDLWYNGVIPRWYVEGDDMVERTDVELATMWEQYQTAHPPQLTEVQQLQKENELLKAQLAAQSERSDFIEDVLQEMIIKAQ
ncbi:hypothetical protein [Paenibacillus donghaensis]|uniref:Bacteriophage SP-beta YorD domain-containing protein n=1 Tax=Paenibacillus donghaensis TaxID=414771 RepID=A0A2Z2KD78_9BACL|nr:hypothetical protein [Paenibacillus donghaensis]ASA20953.1 hypothetical protein B9T62_09245 [Paenibacillus donghaensis]ASA22073.1 hypothetical protein B9T62_15590 [Paenibacillus donghaensis]